MLCEAVHEHWQSPVSEKMPRGGQRLEKRPAARGPGSARAVRRSRRGEDVIEAMGVERGPALCSSPSQRQPEDLQAEFFQSFPGTPRSLR